MSAPPPFLGQRLITLLSVILGTIELLGYKSKLYQTTWVGEELIDDGWMEEEPTVDSWVEVEPTVDGWMEVEPTVD